MSVKVSVVVPVHNPGPHLDRNIDSLLAQTLPPGEYEVVYVDDGSTDDTPAKLDKLAAAHPHVSVRHLEHTGSLGRARNAGVADARGEFVQFLGDDDGLDRDALRRLHAFATDNDADIVLPKTWGNFKELPHAVFQRTVERCGLADSDVVDVLDAHQLFRRSFLDEHGLRFPEDQSPMADHAFTAAAYCATDRIAVYADHPCYHWRDRNQATRGPGGLHDREAWFDGVAAVIDTFRSALGSGPGLERALRRVYGTDVHGPLLRRIDWADQDQGFDPWYDEARKTLAAHMPSAIGPTMGVFERVASALLERGDRDRLIDWYRIMKSVKASARLERAAWSTDGAIDLAFTARLTWAGGVPVPFARSGDRVCLDPSLAARFDVDPGALDVTAEIAHHTGDLHIVHRQERLRWPCPARFEPTLTDDGDGGLTIAFTATGAVPTEAHGTRERLDRGLWDVQVGLVGFGLSREVRLGADGDPAVEQGLGPAVLGSPARGVIPFFTKPKGELTVDIGKKARLLARHLTGRRIEPIAGARPGLVLDAATSPATAATSAKLIVEDRDGAWYEVPASLRPSAGRWLLELPLSVRGVAPGNGRLFVRLDPGDAPPLLLGDVSIGADGALSPVTVPTTGDNGPASPDSGRSGH
jgi:glycosyltransferase involved in cell wall biosynthesis